MRYVALKIMWRNLSKQLFLLILNENIRHIICGLHLRLVIPILGKKGFRIAVLAYRRWTKRKILLSLNFLIMWCRLINLLCKSSSYSSNATYYVVYHII